MTGMIKKVFVVIAVLLACLIAWTIIMGEGGILQNAWNGLAEPVNDTWQAITGSSDDVMPSWEVTDVADGVDNVADSTSTSGGDGGSPE